VKDNFTYLLSNQKPSEFPGLVGLKEESPIISATYGPATVTEIVRRLFKEGRREFPASNNLFGDP
jgi:hypothetical protein